MMKIDKALSPFKNFVDLEILKFIKEENDFVPIYGYRWYYPRNVRFLKKQKFSENGKNYSNCINTLKLGDYESIHFFGTLLKRIIYENNWYDLPLFLFPLPPHDASPSSKDYPLAKVRKAAYWTEYMNNYYSQTNLIQKILYPRRVKTLSDDWSSRKELTVEEIKNTMEINTKININKFRILIIDDVFTTGKTIQACIEIVKESFSSAEIIALAFGKTQNNDNVFFPEEPVFKDPPSRYHLFK